jgi:lipopolysaccharide transport system ATP-binding protein
MSTVIKIENLYKEYRLGVIGHGTLYRDLQSWWAKLKGKEDPNTLIGGSNYNRNKKDQLLALDDINLEIKAGEALGIIGSNGAGKSTFLKILSRVTAPTKGRIKIRGSIASLLEVGTGFHPELTGRENIYLNGAINAMNKNEVSRKLDEIVDFAGVEQFLDTPVKRYSTGMHVRLGFAVAAHLEPDVLVVDEVLAVGDASFQKKAIGKIQDMISGEGRTVLFVSHNLDSIQRLCPRTILMHHGIIKMDGLTAEVIESYKESSSGEAKRYAGERKWEIEEAPGNDIVRIIAIRTIDQNQKNQSEFDVTEPVIIEIEYRVLKAGHKLAKVLEFFDLNSNQSLMRSLDKQSIDSIWGFQKNSEIGLFKSRCIIPKNTFGESNITVNFRISSPPHQVNLSSHVLLQDGITFNMFDNNQMNGSKGTYPYYWGSELRPSFNWELVTLP